MANEEKVWEESAMLDWHVIYVYIKEGIITQYKTSHWTFRYQINKFTEQEQWCKTKTGVKQSCQGQTILKMLY